MSSSLFLIILKHQQFRSSPSELMKNRMISLWCIQTYTKLWSLQFSTNQSILAYCYQLACNIEFVNWFISVKRLWCSKSCSSFITLNQIKPANVSSIQKCVPSIYHRLFVHSNGGVYDSQSLLYTSLLPDKSHLITTILHFDRPLCKSWNYPLQLATIHCV